MTSIANPLVNAYHTVFEDWKGKILIKKWTHSSPKFTICDFNTFQTQEHKTGF